MPGLGTGQAADCGKGRVPEVFGSRTEFEADMWSRTCAYKGHQNCPHFHATTWVIPLPPSRFDGRLCTCSCHSSCPITAKNRAWTSMGAWLESCTCPGAERLRHSLNEAQD